MITTASAPTFRLMADWERSKTCRVLWPYRKDIWRKNAVPAQETMVSVVSAIHDLGTEVTVYTKPDLMNSTKSRFPKGVKVKTLDYNDIWIRDTGPTFVMNDATKEVKGIDWNFNAYGGIYKDFADDNNLARRLMCQMQMGTVDGTYLTAEGGAFVTDGEGTVITTESVLLNPNRNPGLTKEKVEEVLKRLFDVDTIIWLKDGLYGDIDTDGHADNMVAFVNPKEVLLAWSEDPLDPQHFISVTAENTLLAHGLKVHRVHCPLPMFVQKEEMEDIEFTKDTFRRGVGDTLPASYINYYRAKDGIVLPLYGSLMTDNSAVDTFKRVFKGKKIMTVNARELVLGGGSIHCATN
jgi:agmatine deiminase